jgi:hypothetical protein
MLHLHAVPQPGRITLRSHSFRAMQEVIIRLTLMHLPFEYYHDGYSHIVTTTRVEEGRSLLGSPTFENADRIVVVEEG